MKLYIFNLNFEFLGIVEEINDLEWIRDYYRGGDFSLNAKMNDLNIKLLKKDNIIIKDMDFNEPMIIEYRQLDENDDGDEELMVTGTALSTRILSSRISLGRQIEKETANKVMENILLTQTNYSKDSNRHFPNLVVDRLNKPDFVDVIEHNTMYKDLYTDFEEICRDNQCSYKVIYKYEAKQFLFKVYKGKDVSDSVLFSTEYDNVKKQSFIESSDNYYNVAIVAGQGEELERDLVVVNNEKYSGFNRREVFIDARDIEQDTKRGTDDSGYEIDIPIHNGAEAVKKLTTRGNEKLAELKEVNSFDGELIENNYKYKEDFDLGSLVTIRNKKWGIEFKQRITKIIESYTIYGRNISVTFGEELPTINDKLKQQIKRG